MNSSGEIIDGFNYVEEMYYNKIQDIEWAIPKTDGQMYSESFEMPGGFYMTSEDGQGMPKRYSTSDPEYFSSIDELMDLVGKMDKAISNTYKKMPENKEEFGEFLNDLIEEDMEDFLIKTFVQNARDLVMMEGDKVNINDAVKAAVASCQPGKKLNLKDKVFVIEPHNNRASTTSTQNRSDAESYGKYSKGSKHKPGQTDTIIAPVSK